METKKHYAIFQQPGEEFLARVGSIEIARSKGVVELQEISDKADYAPVYYFPPDSIDGQHLSPNDHSTQCPIKGTATYHDLVLGGEVLKNAVWSYQDPIAGCEPIKGFYALDTTNYDIQIFRDGIIVEHQGFIRKKEEEVSGEG